MSREISVLDQVDHIQPAGSYATNVIYSIGLPPHIAWLACFLIISTCWQMQAPVYSSKIASSKHGVCVNTNILLIAYNLAKSHIRRRINTYNVSAMLIPVIWSQSRYPTPWPYTRHQHDWPPTNITLMTLRFLRNFKNFCFEKCLVIMSPGWIWKQQRAWHASSMLIDACINNEAVALISHW